MVCFKQTKVYDKNHSHYKRHLQSLEDLTEIREVVTRNYFVSMLVLNHWLQTIYSGVIPPTQTGSLNMIISETRVAICLCRDTGWKFHVIVQVEI